MTRSLSKLVLGLFLVGLSAATAYSQATTAPPPIGEKPTVTIIAVGPDDVFADLKVIIAEIAKSPEEFKTLKETVDVFLTGVDVKKPVAIRSFVAGDDLRHVASIPMQGEAGLKDFLTNLWDLGVKSAPPPAQQFRSQIPTKVNTKLRTLKLAATERLLFDLKDGFLRSETGLVQIGELLSDVRTVKGMPPTDLLQKFKIVAILDGTAVSPADRRKMFQSRRKQFFENFQANEGEDPADFAIRKLALEHQFDELERFFADASNITVGWTTAVKEKYASLDLTMKALADTSLAASIEQLAKTPDDFAAIDRKDSVAYGGINFPIDDLRKQALLTGAKNWRDRVKQKIDADTKAAAEKKPIDKELSELSFDIVNDIANAGIFNGFIRVRKDASGNYSTVGAAKIPDSAKIVQMVEKMAQREGADKVALKADTEGDIEIHKVTLTEHQKEYAEFLGSDGTVFVGTGSNVVWYAAGPGALDVLKSAIKETKAAGPKSGGPVIELVVQGGVGVEFLEKHFPKPAEPPRRTPAASSKTATKTAPGATKTAPATTKTADKTAAGSKKTAADDKNAERLEKLKDLGLRKVALDAFKEGNDTITIRLEREENSVKLNIRFDEGILRFVGKAVAKGVKENLGD